MPGCCPITTPYWLPLTPCCTPYRKARNPFLMWCSALENPGFVGRRGVDSLHRWRCKSQANSSATKQDMPQQDTVEMQTPNYLLGFVLLKQHVVGSQHFSLNRAFAMDGRRSQLQAASRHWQPPRNWRAVASMLAAHWDTGLGCSRNKGEWNLQLLWISFLLKRFFFFLRESDRPGEIWHKAGLSFMTMNSWVEEKTVAPVAFLPR